MIKKNKRKICWVLKNIMEPKRYAEIEVSKKTKDISLPVSVDWHSECCFICMEDFSIKRPRVMLWSCKHNTCWECYEKLVSMSKLKCTYCQSKHIDSIPIHGYVGTKLPDGEHIFAPKELGKDCEKLTRDYVQQNIINNLKKINV
jgi:hypothetical protein